MNERGGWLVACVGLVMLPSMLAAEGGTLNYRYGPPTVLEQEVGTVGGKELTVAEEKPELRSQPALTGEATYILVELGERGSAPYIAVFDPEANEGRGAVYFDLDHDGDLAEEAPLAPQRWGASANFGPIEVKLDREGFVGLYHCWMQRRQGRPDSWWLLAGCYNVGQVTFFGKTYGAATVDAWTNGRFNDICWSRLGQGDLILIDFNEDGRFAYDEQILVGERGWHEGQWYRKQVSADGTEVTFGPGDFEFGTLVTGHDGFWMQITSRSNVGSVQFGGSGGRVGVPADEYGLYLSWVEKTDDQGTTWRAQPKHGGPYHTFEVKAGQENHYAFGPPFTVALQASPSGPHRPGQVVTFQLSVTGAEGKKYLSTRDRQPPAAPRMVIRDESGREIGTYAFSYGRGGIAAYSWLVPQELKGTLTATPSIDAGPFKWKAEELVLKVE